MSSKGSRIPPSTTSPLATDALQDDNQGVSTHPHMTAHTAAPFRPLAANSAKRGGTQGSTSGREAMQTLEALKHQVALSDGPAAPEGVISLITRDVQDSAKRNIRQTLPTA